MNMEATLGSILSNGAIGIVRMETTSGLVRVVEALASGGMDCIEITMTTPGALAAIETVAERLPDVVIGAGTVLDGETACDAIRAGARFLVTPAVTLDVVEAARRYGAVSIPGAMTPTEVLSAWQAGANLIKLFPASVGGPGFFSALKGPLPQIPLVATGGVSAENAPAYIEAGAAAVCFGGSLIPKRIVEESDYDELTRRTERAMERVSEAMKGRAA